MDELKKEITEDGWIPVKIWEKDGVSMHMVNVNDLLSTIKNIERRLSSLEGELK